MSDIGFSSIMDFVFTIYDMLIVTSRLIWEWFSAPIGNDIAEFLNIPLDTTNLDIMLGTFVPVMLTLTLTSFVFKALLP